MKNNDLVASKILEIRKEKNIKALYVAQQLGISESSFSRIEKGKQEITVNFLYGVAQVLQVSVNKLLGIETGVELVKSHNAQIGNNNSACHHSNNTINEELVALLKQLVEEKKAATKLK